MVAKYRMRKVQRAVANRFNNQQQRAEKDGGPDFGSVKRVTTPRVIKPASYEILYRKVFSKSLSDFLLNPWIYFGC